MPRPKGLAKTGGRRKGTPNQFTADVRPMVYQALQKAGGVDYLVRQADENPGPFLSLVSRCMPKEIHQEVTAEIRIRQETRRELIESVVALLAARNTAQERTALPGKWEAIEAAEQGAPCMTNGTTDTGTQSTMANCAACPETSHSDITG